MPRWTRTERQDQVTTKYEGVSDEMLEKIASDVRTFDAAYTTDAKQQRDIKRIADILAKQPYADDEMRMESRRRTVALEVSAICAIMALPTFDTEILWTNRDVSTLLRRYGVGERRP